jgi:hypothetical protein
MQNPCRNWFFLYNPAKICSGLYINWSLYNKVPVNAENTFLLFKERRPFKLKKEYPSEQWQIISFRLIPLKTPVSFRWTVPLRLADITSVAEALRPRLWLLSKVPVYNKPKLHKKHKGCVFSCFSLIKMWHTLWFVKQIYIHHQDLTWSRNCISRCGSGTNQTTWYFAAPSPAEYR